MNRPSVTVIVLSWNAQALLSRCLPSVAASTYPNLEIVLADNASTDESTAWVSEHLPGVRIITHASNWGFCRGNNEAIRQTSSDFVVLLNNDVEVEPGWLEPLVALAEADSGIGAIQPKILDFHHRDRFEYAGAAGGHLDRFGYPFARGRVFFHLEDDAGQYDAMTDIFWASGAAMFLRRSAVDTVGLLDEAFEFHMEEIDLCWRLQRAGYRVVAEPSSRVYHLGGGSLVQGSPRKTLYNFRNSLLMLYKNLPASEFRRAFLARLVLDGVASLRFVALGEFRNAAAVLSAFWQAHRMKRRYTPPTGPALGPSYRRSIVVDYFLRRRRAFSALDPDDFLSGASTSGGGRS